MKNKIFLSILLILLLSGCVKMDNTLIINKDGSSDFTMIYGIDSQLYSSEMGAPESMDEFKSDAEKSGFKVVTYKDKEFTGLKISKHFESYKDIKFVNNSESKMNFKVNEQKGFFKNKYAVEAVYDLRGMSDEMGDGSEGFDEQILNSILGKMDLKFTLKLPVKSGDNNASNVSDEGKTLTWDLLPDKNNELKVQFEKVNTLNIVLLAVGIVVALISTLIVIFKKRKPTIEETF
ncbi:LppM family (lipo)protein [Neobacillus sp. SCS-31]|uniref:LppM family (lipo)protein n=1 Tax=Neobacillus oceani TaxID=3115292 RepID=UPI003905F40A